MHGPVPRNDLSQCGVYNFADAMLRALQPLHHACGNVQACHRTRWRHAKLVAFVGKQTVLLPRPTTCTHVYG